MSKRNDDHESYHPLIPRLRDIPLHHERALHRAYGNQTIKLLGDGNVASVYAVQSKEGPVAVKMRSDLIITAWGPPQPEEYSVRDESFKNDLEKQFHLNGHLSAEEKEYVRVGDTIHTAVEPLNDNAHFNITWIEMPYDPEGRPLSQLEVEAKLNDVDTLRAILHDVLLGLRHCHKAGVIHGDIDASNMIVSGAARTSLIDFGLSRQIGHETALSTINPKHGFAAWGAPERTAPELREQALASPAWDVYGFGSFIQKHQPASHRALRGSTEALSIDPTQRPTIEELLASVSEW